MDLRKKIVLIGVAQLVVTALVLFVSYYFEAKEKVQQQYVEKARSVVLTTESTREEMGKKWDQGIFTAEQLRQWADARQMDKVLAAVPVVTAWKAAMAKAGEGGYTFNVPKFHARNPDNEPDEFQTRILRKLMDEHLDEYHEIDPEINAIRYYRPIKLTEECLLCHGDPARSAELWGNDQGLDPTGAKMENWEVGQVHGAFEVVQSLDEADAQIAGSMRTGAILVTTLLILAGGIFYWVITHSVVRPVRRIVDDLNDGADQVNDASHQVSSSSVHLAEAASQQAISLQETVGAIHRIAAQTRENANDARSANELTGKTRDAADEGDRTMKQLNEAMAGINESSEKIGKIIKVIEEIAFQTNLLALNAAVEAARAGEHGKGFAVVADEVRNLAQRTAKSAGETTGLIENAVERARQGSDVAGQVGRALSAIVGHITEVSDLVNGIAGASDEQTRGVDDVNRSMGDMDKVTQQNASTAEESAAAAEQLSAQAQSVKSTVENLQALISGK